MESKITTILLVEDDDSLRNALSFILENADYSVFSASSAENALLIMAKTKIDIGILDVGLPGMDGLALASKFPKHPNTASARIIMLTGDASEEHMVRALESVADDYVLKPTKPRMLLARIRAVLRRGPSEKNKAFSNGNLTIDPIQREARLDDELLVLTKTEFDLLELFMNNPGKVFNRLELIEAIHGSTTAISERSIDFQIHGLRSKLGSCGERLTTVRGVGFKLTPML